MEPKSDDDMRKGLKLEKGEVEGNYRNGKKAELHYVGKGKSGWTTSSVS